jgi:hypothetical protein
MHLSRTVAYLHIPSLLDLMSATLLESTGTLSGIGITLGLPGPCSKSNWAPWWKFCACQQARRRDAERDMFPEYEQLIRESVQDANLEWNIAAHQDCNNRTDLRTGTNTEPTITDNSRLSRRKSDVLKSNYNHEEEELKAVEPRLSEAVVDDDKLSKHAREVVSSE